MVNFLNKNGQFLLFSNLHLSQHHIPKSIHNTSLFKLDLMIGYFSHLNIYFIQMKSHNILYFSYTLHKFGIKLTKYYCRSK